MHQQARMNADAQATLCCIREAVGSNLIVGHHCIRNLTIFVPTPVDNKLLGSLPGSVISYTFSIGIP